MTATPPAAYFLEEAGSPQSMGSTISAGSSTTLHSNSILERRYIKQEEWRHQTEQAQQLIARAQFVSAGLTQAWTEAARASDGVAGAVPYHYYGCVSI